MLQCSQCGTQNRDGSKFCGDCGARLMQQSGLVCPMCSEPNTVENVFCQKCGARLVPLTVAPTAEKMPRPAPIKGLSLPAKPTESPAPAATVEPKPAEPSAPAVAAESKPVEPPAPARQVEPEPAPSAGAQSDDWLARLRETPSEEIAPPDELPVLDESGDWLTRLRAVSSSEQAAPPVPMQSSVEAGEVTDEDLPDWLRSTVSDSEDEIPSRVPQPPTEARQSAHAPMDEKIDWMDQPRLEEEQIPSVPTADSGSEIPDWLKDAGSAPAAELPAPSAEELAWFKPVAAEPEMPPPVPATEEEIPDWLKSLKPKEEEPVAPAAPVEFAGLADQVLPAVAMPGEELIESLQAEPVSAPILPEEPIGLTATPRRTGEEEDVPDWLRTPVTGVPPAQTETTAEAIAELSEVPDWIAALKPVEGPAPSIFDSGPMEASGPLAGLRGVLPLAAAIVEPHAPPKPAPPSPFKESASIFESILAAPALAPAVPSAKPTRRGLTMRPFIYALMLLAVLIPFFVPDIANSSVRTFGTRTAEFYDIVQALPPNATVVLSFDYDPGSAGEMDLQASAIVRHLISKRVRIVAISTADPTGAQIAQDVLDNAARAAGNYTYGTNYLNLGFIAGQEAGLRQLATGGFVSAMHDYSKYQTLDKYPSFANLQNWRNVALLIEFAGAPEPLQKWMEQVQARAGVKIAAGVSAMVEPRARVYRNSNQLVAMLSGMLGAAQYEALSNQRGLAMISVGAQSTAQLALVGLVILGNLVFWFSRGRGKAK